MERIALYICGEKINKYLVELLNKKNSCTYLWGKNQQVSE